jgi:hypothetical protein
MIRAIIRILDALIQAAQRVAAKVKMDKKRKFRADLERDPIGALNRRYGLRSSDSDKADSAGP